MSNLEQINIAAAKQHLSAVINQVAYGQRRIVITSRNRPKVAIVNLEDLKKIEEKTKQQQGEYRMTAFKKADQLHDQISRKIKTDPMDMLQEKRHDRTTQLIDNLY